MRVLVTGGAGFIGSNLVYALMGAHEVGVIDDLSTGSVDNLHPAAWSRTLDITDERLPALVAEFRSDAVVHLAAQASVAASLLDPARDRTVNVEGTRAVAAAAREAGARRVISASSAAVYGEPVELPLRETAAKSPENPYGASKLAAEGVIAEELAGSGTDWASVRFSNVFGPRQDARGEGGVVAVFCDSLAAGQAPTIHGSGTQTRDFVFVGDVVNAILMALDVEAPPSEGLATGRKGSGDGNGVGASDDPAYNISTGVQTSVEDIARILRPLAGFYGEFERAEAREGDVSASALDPSKAREVFGWSARASLEVALAQTYRWFALRHPDRA